MIQGICRLVNDGKGCFKLDPTHGCTVYNHGGARFRDRQGYCPIPDDGPNKPKTNSVKSVKVVRAGQQKQKKKNKK